ncbi:HTH-type transcriptional repressor NagR [Rubrobacter xylanophilus DSM 9941]|uniref:GntR family transcriptional regulator n=1 Tax=Rubrobacter xylanophilus TaxID=49319 RepID=UPI001C6405B6|nr:GntR family transcriptional regulator [Rubrobacter xylanophilus]QYJ16830.1 HTH-type transcriptional repressor NagR [Rubrobacter xylanophilus DSM 9941]
MAGIDTESPVPKYYQLKEIIRDMIEKEELRAGQAIPSEREFCERYGISRMTARQAIMELVNEGLLYREQGRGTFVAEKKLQQEAARLTSFTQDMRDRGMRPSSRVLELEVEPAGPVVARMLGVDRGIRIVRLRRVRDADGEPMALETSHLLYEVAKGVLEADLAAGSLYEELGKVGVRMSRAEQSYEAGLVNEAEAEHLGVPAGSPALLIERITFDQNDRPFEYVKSTYRADRYRVTTVLYPQ